MMCFQSAECEPKIINCCSLSSETVNLLLLFGSVSFSELNVETCFGWLNRVAAWNEKVWRVWWRTALLWHSTRADPEWYNSGELWPQLETSTRHHQPWPVQLVELLYVLTSLTCFKVCHLLFSRFSRVLCVYQPWSVGPHSGFFTPQSTLPGLSKQRR